MQGINQLRFWLLKWLSMAVCLVLAQTCCCTTRISMRPDSSTPSAGAPHLAGRLLVACSVGVELALLAILPAFAAAENALVVQLQARVLVCNVSLQACRCSMYSLCASCLLQHRSRRASWEVNML